MHSSLGVVHFPLVQSLSGLMAWRITNLRRLRHCIFLQFLNNLLAVIILPFVLIVLRDWLKGL